MASSERIFELLETPTENEEEHEETEHIIKAVARSSLRMSTSSGEDAEDWILKGVSFSVGASQSLALVGATGSGKHYRQSALWLYPIQSGEIFVDGVEIKKWNVDELRERISIEQQDVFLFSAACAITLGSR